MSNYSAQSGQEVVDYHQSARNKRAATLKAERKRIGDLLKGCPGLETDIRLRNQAIRDCVAAKCGPARRTPFRPTPENFRRAATKFYYYGFSDWSNPHDTEYYSACGYDDYQGELQNSARCQAVEYFRAWKVLTGK